MAKLDTRFSSERFVSLPPIATLAEEEPIDEHEDQDEMEDEPESEPNSQPTPPPPIQQPQPEPELQTPLSPLTTPTPSEPQREDGEILTPVISTSQLPTSPEMGEVTPITPSTTSPLLEIPNIKPSTSFPDDMSVGHPSVDPPPVALPAPIWKPLFSDPSAPLFRPGTTVLGRYRGVDAAAQHKVKVDFDISEAQFALLNRWTRRYLHEE